MFIYCITNKLNGKKYIGQTIQKNPYRRVRYHFNKHSGRWETIISNAIAKYGSSNFSVEILEECSSIEELNFLERYYIKHFDTLRPNGYNISNGGDGKGRTSEETKQKISSALKGKGKNRAFLGKKFSQIHRENLSKARKGIDTPNRIAARKAWTDRKYRQKITFYSKNLLTGEVRMHHNMTDAAKELGLQACNIGRVLNGKQGRKQHKGYTFWRKQ